MLSKDSLMIRLSDWMTGFERDSLLIKMLIKIIVFNSIQFNCAKDTPPVSIATVINLKDFYTHTQTHTESHSPIPHPDRLLTHTDTHTHSRTHAHV